MHRSGAQDRQVRDLLAENADLKKFQEQIKRDVQSILSRHDLVPGQGLAEDSAGVGKRAGVGRTRSARAGDAGFSLKKQWSSLKQLVANLEVQAAQSGVTHVISVTDHEKELTRLRKEMGELQGELQNSQELISQQQQLLQEQMLPTPGEGQPSPLWDAYFLEEQLRLQQDRAAFEEQKLAFQDEREKFTEAAIRLGRERLQFKADQALFVKQQFLNMTPGLETPPWKKTPPWSAFTTGTPTRMSLNHKQTLTPNWSCARNSHCKKGFITEPETPSTEELYRVLRLAPPSRSGLLTKRHERTRMKSEWDSNESRSDSLSPSSDETLPRSARPLKLSITPYLRPRPTPSSVSCGHQDVQTPGTVGLYRMLGLASTGRPSSGSRRRDSALRKSLLHHSRNRERFYEGTPTVFCQEAFKKGETGCDFPHERTRASYDTDSLCSEDSGRLCRGDGDTPLTERGTCPRDGSECVDRDSLCDVSPLCGGTTYASEDQVHFVGDRNGVPCLHVTDQGDDNSWPCNKRARQVSDGYRSHSREHFHPREILQSLSNEDLYPRDQKHLGENFPPRDHCTSRDRGVHHRKPSSCSWETHQSMHCSRNQSKESQNQDCRSNGRQTPHPRGDGRSRSDYRRASSHHRDSWSSSGHRNSSHHLRRSCPSARDHRHGTRGHTGASHLCADLLGQFLDCSL
ncbi:uncharacterized protein RCH25_018240 [Pelodytes ibericus]